MVVSDCEEIADQTKIAELALFVASIIFTFAFAILFLSATSFLLKGSITFLPFILSLPISLFYCFWNAKSSLTLLSKKLLAWGCILFLLSLVISIIISSLFYDMSWDGQAYHQEAILKLQGGWNPFWEKLPETEASAIWLNYYAKASWIIAAASYQVTHQIETAKLFNILFIAASFLMSFSVLLLSLKLRKKEAVFISLLFALNPVAVCQVLSFYVDGQLASILLSFACVSYLLATKPNYTKTLLPLLAFNICILVNIKFTAVIYTVIFIFGLIVWLFIKSSRWRYQSLGISLVSLSIGLFFIGYNPYVRNTTEMGHPFYPIYGSKPADLISVQVPKNFSDNSFENLFLSLFSKSDDMPATTAEPKVPLTLGSSEIRAFFNADVRMGGFGPLFSGAVLLSLIILSIAAWSNFEGVQALLFMTWVLLFSVFVNPQAWWARYAPQLWLVAPFSLVLTTLRQDHAFTRRSLKLLGRLLALILSLNLLLISGAYLYQNTKSSWEIRHQLRALAVNKNSFVVVYFQDFASNRARFFEYGINFSEVPEAKKLPCTSPLTFVHSNTLFCLKSAT